MSYDKYPAGHYRYIPKIELNEFNNTLFGFIHYKILPPRGPYLFVLPTKIRGPQSDKLLVCLCQPSMISTNFKCKHH